MREPDPAATMRAVTCMGARLAHITTLL